MQCKEIVINSDHLFWTNPKIVEVYKHLAKCLQQLRDHKELSDLIKQALELLTIYYTCIKQKSDPVFDINPPLDSNTGSQLLGVSVDTVIEDKKLKNKCRNDRRKRVKTIGKVMDNKRARI